MASIYFFFAFSKEEYYYIWKCSDSVLPSSRHVAALNCYVINYLFVLNKKKQKRY